MRLPRAENHTFGSRIALAKDVFRGELVGLAHLGSMPAPADAQLLGQSFVTLQVGLRRLSNTGHENSAISQHAMQWLAHVLISKHAQPLVQGLASKNLHGL